MFAENFYNGVKNRDCPRIDIKVLIVAVKMVVVGGHRWVVVGNLWWLKWWLYNDNQ